MRYKIAMSATHIPVLLEECMQYLRVRAQGTFLDGTFGEGGHSLEMAKRGGRVFAIDRDESAVEQARATVQGAGVTLNVGLFSQFDRLYPGTFWDGILLDLGVSTRQLLEPERGFSFSSPAQLDMRMGKSSPRLGDKLLSVDPEVLADFLREKGVKGAGRLAHQLVQRVRDNPDLTTEALADVAGKKRGPRHPATVLFLALRMWVNEESEEVDRALPKMVEALKVGGRLVVLTFHSEEDRRVKRWFKRLAGECVCEQDLCLCPRTKRVQKITRKPVLPSEGELRRNPRSRSAKLRCVEKLPSDD